MTDYFVISFRFDKFARQKQQIMSLDGYSGNTCLSSQDDGSRVGLAEPEGNVQRFKN